jgi:hypothetical protein
MSIILYVLFSILFASTFVQGHDNFTADNILSSSSSELENTLRQHNNPIRIGKLY